MEPHSFWSAVSGSGSRRQKRLTKVEKIQVLKYWIFSFEDEDFDVLYGGPGKSKLQFQKNLFFSALNFFKLLVTKTLDPDPQ
jgi:hypothetical protein